MDTDTETRFFKGLLTMKGRYEGEEVEGDEDEDEDNDDDKEEDSKLIPLESPLIKFAWEDLFALELSMNLDSPAGFPEE